MRVGSAIVWIAVESGGCAAALHPVSVASTGPTTQPVAVIDSFQGKDRFLSNFYPATVEFEGLTYPDVEHAYQSAKTLDMALRRRIAAQPTPGDAKRMGESFPPRADWPDIKLAVMEQCVLYKFSHHPELRAELLATGDATLIEGNTWNDRFWGVVHDPDGRPDDANHLGLILMNVRHQLRATPSSP